MLATDASADAIAFAAHLLHLNGGTGEVGMVDWAEHGDTLVELGPWDLVLAADVLYVRANVELASRLLPRLVEPGGEIRLADPRSRARATSSPPRAPPSISPPPSTERSPCTA